jgi:hypothetical protein
VLHGTFRNLGKPGPRPAGQENGERSAHDRTDSSATAFRRFRLALSDAHPAPGYNAPREEFRRAGAKKRAYGTDEIRKIATSGHRVDFGPPRTNDL